MASDRPLVSVVIATFNWSAALRLAIRSVLNQTLRDFEIRVVGDGCTDDSAAVVAAFGDPRIHWANLGANSGSQQAPNNAGLAAAQGEWIAYLGHDDIWSPRHLEATLAAARAAGTEAAAGGMIMYGPPGSGATSTAGVFALGHCSDRDFVPPSAFMHTRALVERIGGWTDPRTIRLPTDCDFFRRVRAVSPVAPSNAITVFKFNAAVRRNAYQTKSTTEQEACLAGLGRGDAYVAEQLTHVLASVVAGRWNPIGFPDESQVEPGALFHSYRVVKGVEPRFDLSQLRPITGAERFRIEHEPVSYEWYPTEISDDFGSFRWTGPADRSNIEFPFLLDRPLSVRIHVLAAAVEPSMQTIRLLAQGAPIETSVERTVTGTWIVAGVIDPARVASPVPYVQIALTGVTAVRPSDIGVHSDGRQIGVAVNWVELAPA